MKRWIVVLGIAVLANSAMAADVDGPALIGATQSAPCREALGMAQAAFLSDQAQPVPAVQVSATSSSKLVAGADVDEPADAVDPRVFTKLPVPEPEGAVVFWQTQPSHGRRLVIDQVTRSMHDTFKLRSVNAALAPSSYVKRRADDPAEASEELFSSVLRIPVIFQSEGTGELWAIDSGSVFGTLPPWKVYFQESGRYRMGCQIQFQSATGARVPRHIKRLENLLLRSVGPGRGHAEFGSFHHVFEADRERIWTNAILRPWSIPQQQFNTRAQVDAGLKQWARGGQARGALLQEILSQLPLAERSLATRYKHAFGMDNAKSEQLAHRWIDAMLRAYYYFPDQQ